MYRTGFALLDAMAGALPPPLGNERLELLLASNQPGRHFFCGQFG